MRTLSTLLAEVTALLRPTRTHYLVLALVLQGLYWYLGSPGPLLAGAPRTIETALSTVAWALALLLVAPLAVMLVRRDLPASIGFGWGDWRFGASATLLVGGVAVAALWVGAQWPAIQTAYPWAGAWPGLSPAHLLAWTALYALYYVAFEFFYRGFMLRALEPLWGLAAAVWLQGSAYVLIHLGKPLPEVLAAVPFALLFAVLAVRGRSLLWPILLHLLIGVATDVFSLRHQGLLWP